jgi:hypothetical protein
MKTLAKKNPYKEQRSLLGKLGASKKCAEDFGACMFRHFKGNVWIFESWNGTGFVLNNRPSENRFKYCKAILR